MILLLLVGSVLLFCLVPESSRSGGWTNNVLRNWEDFGFAKLQGKLVSNPGGFEVFDRPQIYAGHRAYCLYPSYVIGHIFGGAGSVLLPFYLLLAVLVGISVTRLLGGNSFAALTACLVVFSPGYIRAAVGLDPLGAVVLLGFPALVLFIRLLGTKTPTWTSAAGLVFATTVFAALNWTSIFVFAAFFAWLLIHPAFSFRRIAGFAGLVIILVGSVGAISVMDKAQGAAATPTAGSMQHYFNSYLFGQIGYDGAPMNWTRACVRLISANIVGLLPVLIVFLFVAFRSIRKHGRPALLYLLPLGVTLLSILGMRNYFAHHPWMAATVLLIGLVLSMQLMLGTDPIASGPGTAPIEIPLSFAMAVLMGGLVYGSAVTLVSRASARDYDALITIVRQHTARTDPINIMPQNDPWLVENSARLASLFDRRLVLSNAQLFESQTSRPATPEYLLTLSRLDERFTLVAQTGNSESGLQETMNAMLHWYRTTIAQRRQGDRLEVSATYYLYKATGMTGGEQKEP